MTDEKVKTVRFKEPPPKREPRYDWAAIAAKIKRRPNEWALVFTNDLTSTVVAVRNDGIAALRKDKGFLVRTANNKPGPPRTCDLYIMYDPALDQTKEN